MYKANIEHLIYSETAPAYCSHLVWKDSLDIVL